MIRKLILWLVLVMILSVNVSPAEGQSSSWSEPLNLSQSGAAEQPRLVAAPNGAVQVFWKDRFDGLTTAYFNGSSWTAGISAPLDLGTGEMPQFILADGRVHAFWEKQSQGVRGLWHASMLIGEFGWGIKERLAESTLGFKTLALEDGAVVVAYLHIAQDWDEPAGIYFLRLEPGVFVWNTRVGLDTSAYYRLETSDTAWIHLAADGKMLTAIWREPHSDGYRARTSLNAGWNWGSLETLALPADHMSSPRSLYHQGGRMLIWQDEGTPGCTLVQKSDEESWTSGLLGLAECPGTDSSWSSGAQLFWMWGQGTRVMSLAAWDGQVWTQPLVLSFMFTDPLDGTTKYLQDLQAIQTGGVLYVAGSDGFGEVWFLQSQLETVQLVQAPRPAWSMVNRLSSSTMAAAEPSVSVEPGGKFHLVWLEGFPGGAYTYLNYAAISEEVVSTVVSIQRAAVGEYFRQPALLADPTGWLHLAWSGGSQGKIHYSRVLLADAGNPGAWSPVQVLSDRAGAWPQLARDSSGGIFLLYVVPLNEDRGVFLLRSRDQGDNWTQPEIVFDAQVAGWDNLGSGALAIAPSLDGSLSVNLHAAWVEEALPDTVPARGIWYSRAAFNLSSNEPLVWSEPFRIADQGACWPRLVIAGGNLHLIYGQSEQGVWNRHISLSAAPGDVSGWSTATAAAGWDVLASFDGRPFGVAASGSPASPPGVVHLAGMPQIGRLTYTSWMETRWGGQDVSVIPGLNQETAIWVDAASLAAGGRLGMAWVSADENNIPAVWWASRTIPDIDALPEPTPLPTSVPETISIIEPTAIPQPSPTPDLNKAPVMTISSDTPLILGGGLAALLVIGFMLARRRED